MNKKGFTLVELLAVIAILALLVIIALPNVLSMFNSAKKDIFLTEAKSIYKEVSKKYISETMKGNKITKISSNGTKLDMDSNGLTYNISLDDKGNIKKYVIYNDTYCISSSKKIDELTSKDIKEDCTYNELHNISGTLMKDFYEKGNITNKLLISSINFYNDNKIIDSAEKYDVSEEQNNSIIMYITKSYETPNGKYYNEGINSTDLLTLSIVSNGNIALPEDSSNLFSFWKATSSSNGPLSNLEKIKFNCSVDTHNVKNMSNMFAHSSMYEIDLDCFDTSNVTDMSYMFARYDFAHKVETGILYNLDLSNFDTSNVTNMSGMFYHSKAKQITGLDKFNTNSVTSSSNMFSSSTSLVGGSGTKYDSTKTDKTYARIDTTSTPGYFTAK